MFSFRFDKAGFFSGLTLMILLGGTVVATILIFAIGGWSDFTILLWKWIVGTVWVLCIITVLVRLAIYRYQMLRGVNPHKRDGQPPQTAAEPQGELPAEGPELSRERILMKVSIIGGGGLVGSMAGFALQCGGVASSLCLIDANQDAAQGQALDLLQGSCLTSDQRISAGVMSDVADSKVVVVTAGLRRKPDESRLDLINRNVDLFLNLLEQVKAAGLKNDAYLVVVSNPVDVLTYLAVQRSGLPWQRVIGLGTQLDTARFRSHLARRLQVPPTQVQALILGEHGDSMVPIWSSATIAGLPLEQWPGFSPTLQRDAFEETKTAGAQLIKLKGGSGFAVGLSIREVVESLLLDRRKVLPVSTLQQGLYGVRDVCLSVPTVVGCGGARQQIELALTPRERLGIQQSAHVLREIIDQVEARLAGGSRDVPAPSVSNEPGRSIPRVAWQPVKK